ncbi:MAG TPA: hypothetical protein IAA98_05025 [Candidatus Avipropionibacterium avicola]|uniref:Uncharacterized protein n=1 Tax=Candidatus Avipropionibacterium avicola TaxID=2840701 RepID=A0A9D1KN42_9ACTN|nr:hypothetical protein [Candidatus Avipropionibacterium avicola]
MTHSAEGELWTADAHRAYQSAVELVQRSLDDHSRAVGTVATDDLPATAAALEAALADLSEAEIALTGAAAFWLEDADDPEADDPDASADAPDTGPPTSDDGRVPVLVNLQLSLDVVDPDRLIATARGLDPDATVDTVEDALFVIGAQLGWDAVIGDQLEHLEMRSLATEVHTGA